MAVTQHFPSCHVPRQGAPTGRVLQSGGTNDDRALYSSTLHRVWHATNVWLFGGVGVKEMRNE